jgi:hypothetical protein
MLVAVAARGTQSSKRSAVCLPSISASGLAGGISFGAVLCLLHSEIGPYLDGYDDPAAPFTT